MKDTKLSILLGISEDKFNKNRVFDPLLNTDSFFFINFKLLKKTDIPEFLDSTDLIKERFNNILLLLKHYIKNSNLKFLKKAKKLFNFPEVEGICIGYSQGNTSGSGFGGKLRDSILETAISIINAGSEDPEIFELVGLFEEKIGADRLSDMIAGIIKDNIIEYSKRIYKVLGINKMNYPSHEFNDDLFINPYNNKPLLLLPQTILHELPIAKEWEDVSIVCRRVTEIRDEINKSIGFTWKEKTLTEKKNWLKGFLVNNPAILNKLLEDYKKFDVQNYDFEKDPTGENSWFYFVNNFTTNDTFKLEINEFSEDELFKATKSICEKFKDLVENNGLNEVFYDDNGKPRKEKISQKVFQAISIIYGELNDMDVSPETNSGRGPVDFKFSHGFSKKVIVEMKLTTNQNLIHGYEKQVKEYEKAERTSKSIYLVIDNGGSEKRLKKLYDQNNLDIKSNKTVPEIILIDAKKKNSGSKV